MKLVVPNAFGEATRITSPTRASTATLAPEEGRLAIELPPDARVGVPTLARLVVVPGKGFHINTAYPFSVNLTTPAGVTVAKARLSGGKGEAGDAERLDEGTLAIPLHFTPGAAGDHTVTGTFNFGICKRDLCLTRAVPIRIDVVAT
ncbi:MAG: hypothetical protein H0T79_15700 [Deltaproteobacteria bacterium]|nr:hypothetical protein [Deltaproteobacteria bacterium]